MNLIGEHTDYNEGLALPCAIDRETLALVKRRPGTRVRVFSREMDELAEFDASRPRRGGGWVAAGAYGDRREECRRAFESARRAGVAPAAARALRDLAKDDLPALERALDPLLFRRARHVVTENARVEATVRALRAGRLDAAGACLREGMRSLREDFAVSVPELDALCEIADGLTGVHGSRLTGAGFGGCTVHLVDPARAAAVAESLADGFARRFGRRPPVFACAAAPGASALEAPF